MPVYYWGHEISKYKSGMTPTRSLMKIREIVENLLRERAHALSWVLEKYGEDVS